MKKITFFITIITLLFLSSCGFREVKIEFDSRGGSPVATITNKNDFDVNNLPIPTMTGYSFDGWYLNSSFETSIINNVPKELTFTLYAKWTPNMYTITFNSNGGSKVESISAPFDSTLNRPANPTKEDYEFLGWFKDAELTMTYDFTKMPAGNLTLYAGWEEKLLEINFVVEGLEIEPIKAKKGDEITLPLPSIVGYEFLGWYIDENYLTAVTTITMPEGGATLYGKCQVKRFTLTFISGGDTSVTSITADYNTSIYEPTKPIKQGFTFMGWYLEESLTTPFVFDKMPAENMTLYAGWEPKDVTVTFNHFNDTPNTSVTAKVGSTFDKPIPQYPGHTFINWYQDENFESLFDTWIIPVKNINLYARWEKNTYQIIFISDELNISPLEALYLDNITLPTPSRSGYVFAGWYTDSNHQVLFEETTMPLNGATLYAKWLEGQAALPIQDVFLLNPGTEVTIRGIVYAKLASSYRGYYITDDTNQIFVLSNQIDVNLGDEVLITGCFDRWNDEPMINGISEVLVLTSDNPIACSEPISFDNLSNLSLSDTNYGAHYQMNGILGLEDNELFLYEPFTNNKVKVSHKSYDDTDLDELVGKKYALDVVLVDYKDDMWNIILMFDLMQEETLTNQEKINLIKAHLMSKYHNKGFYPNDSFFIATNDIFGWSIMSFQATTNVNLYDDVNKAFLETQTLATISFSVSITLNDLSDNLTLSIVLHPVEIMSIADFIALGNDNQKHFVKGVVVYKIKNGLAIIKDNTGYIGVIDTNKLELGTEVVFKTMYENPGYYGLCLGIEELTVLQRDLVLPSPNRYSSFELENKMNNQEFVPFELVEITGYLRVNGYQIALELESGFTIPINESSSFNYEKYQNLKVDVLGFFICDYYYGYGFNISETTNPIKVPAYSDTEIVAIIQNSLIYDYLNKDFYTNDYFEIPDSHSILGGEITWSVNENSKQYYDIRNKKLLYVDVETPFSTLVKIKKNDVSLEFELNITIKPLVFTNISDLKEIENNTYLYVKGIIVNRNEDFIILQDETGLVYVEMQEMGFNKGDLVMLEVFKKTNGANPYLIWEHTSFYQVLSYDNSFEVNCISTTSEELINQNDFKTQFIEIKGILNKGNNITLTTGDYTFYIEPANSFLRKDLEVFDSKMVIIRGFLFGYNPNTNAWTILYTGQENIVQEVLNPDFEQLIFIKNTIKTKYDNRIYNGGSALTFDETHMFYDGTISYHVFQDEFHCVDIDNGYLSTVLEDTTIGIEVTITVGELSDTFNIWFTVLKEEVEPLIEYVTIEQLKTSQGEKLSIYAKIIEISQEYILVKDDTGVIYVNYVIWDYYYSSYINCYYYFTGNLINYRGRCELINVEIKEVFIEPEETTTEYEEVSLSNIVSRDHRYDENFGQPVKVRGRLKYENNMYYLTDGVNKVKLLNAFMLYSYIDFNITICGRIFGLDKNSNYDLWSITLTKNKYELDEYQPLEIIDFVGKEIINGYHNLVVMPFENYFLYTNSVFPVLIHYQIIKGNHGVNLNNDYYYVQFLLTENDTEIIFEATVSLEGLSKSYRFSVNLKGFQVFNLEDVFTPQLEAKQFSLMGQLMYIDYTNNFAYFLVDNKVYYVNDINMYGYPGSKYIITGYKGEKNGEYNLNYNLQLIFTNEYDDKFNYLTETMSIQAIYNTNLEENNLRQKCLQVMGRLYYDEVHDQFYLDDEGQQLLLRVNPQEFNYLFNYIDKKIVVKAFFPNLSVRDKFIVDIININDIVVETDTPDEIVDNIIHKIQDEYDQKIYLSYERLNIFSFSYMIKNDYNCTLTWTLLNGPMEDFFNIDRGYEIKWVDQTTIFVFDIEVTYSKDDIIVSKLMQISITVMSREILPIVEVIHSKTRDGYCVKGVVEYVSGTGYGWYYLRDESGIILVDVYMEHHGILGFDVGDELLVYGWYYNDLYPTLNAQDVIRLSTNNEVINNPINMTPEEIWALDYFDLNSYAQSVSVTGILQSRGSYEPYYVLVDGSYEIRLELVYTEEMPYPKPEKKLNDFLGKEVTVSGYIYNFDYVYDIRKWFITFNGTNIILTP